jgi:Fe-S-cluster containining protein
MRYFPWREPFVSSPVVLPDLMQDVRKRFSGYLSKLLTVSAEHGAFGMHVLEALQGELTPTTCANCGVCCNSISLYSLEYHRIVRDLLTRLPLARLREVFERVLLFDQRQAVAGDEKRLRCAFRDDTANVCLIHPVRPFACRFYGMKKADGTRECDHVRDIGEAPPLTEPQIIRLQTRILENSESFSVFPDKPEIHFFPFEFWVFRSTLGPQKALAIYRDLLVPASTPLTRLWSG